MTEKKQENRRRIKRNNSNGKKTAQIPKELTEGDKILMAAFINMASVLVLPIIKDIQNDIKTKELLESEVIE